MQLYGIKNCDVVKKTRKFLENKGVHFDFVDYRETPIAEEKLQNWIDHVGKDVLLNTKSTTWRSLSDSEKQQDVLTLFANHPTLIKRPGLETKSGILVGYKDIEANF